MSTGVSAPNPATVSKVGEGSGVVVGALVGAGLGALVGLIFEHAGVGALVGVGVGGVGGFFVGKKIGADVNAKLASAASQVNQVQAPAA